MKQLQHIICLLAATGCSAGPINDISTDLIDIPTLYAVRGGKVTEQALEYPPAFKEIQKNKYPELRALVTDADLDTAFRACEDLARELWNVVEADRESHRIQAVATTPLLRFKDDVVIEVRSVENNSSEIHLRSRSRLGESDFGANAKRINVFLERLSGIL